jgi:hypothetical protein
LTALGTVRLDLVIAVWLFVIAGCVAPGRQSPQAAAAVRSGSPEPGSAGWAGAGRLGDRARDAVAALACTVDADGRRTPDSLAGKGFAGFDVHAAFA